MVQVEQTQCIHFCVDFSCKCNVNDTTEQKKYTSANLPSQQHICSPTAVKVRLPGYRIYVCRYLTKGIADHYSRLSDESDPECLFLWSRIRLTARVHRVFVMVVKTKSILLQYNLCEQGIGLWYGSQVYWDDIGYPHIDKIIFWKHCTGVPEISSAHKVNLVHFVNPVWNKTFFMNCNAVQSCLLLQS